MTPTLIWQVSRLALCRLSVHPAWSLRATATRPARCWLDCPSLEERRLTPASVDWNLLLLYAKVASDRQLVSLRSDDPSKGRRLTPPQPPPDDSSRRRRVVLARRKSRPWFDRRLTAVADTRPSRGQRPSSVGRQPYVTAVHQRETMTWRHDASDDVVERQVRCHQANMNLLHDLSLNPRPSWPSSPATARAHIQLSDILYLIHVKLFYRIVSYRILHCPPPEKRRHFLE